MNIIRLPRSQLSSLLMASFNCLGRRHISDAPLTIRGTKNVEPKKTWNDLKEKEEFAKYDMMEPIDVKEMPRSVQGFARDMDRMNVKRVKTDFRRIYRGLAVAWCVVGLSTSIYFFGCWAMGRESFLEEIDEEVAIERGELELDEHGKLVPARD